MITSPTLQIDTKQCSENINKMVEKCRANNAIFRPHFKTHQSARIASLFKTVGVDKITVSSVRMAQYFAERGWSNITIAFPFNVLEKDKLMLFPKNTQLNLLVNNTQQVTAIKQTVNFKVNILIEIDVDYARSGVHFTKTDEINELLNEISSSSNLNFQGFLSHFGNSYSARGVDEIRSIYEKGRSAMLRLKSEFILEYPDLIVSIGDTPCCSVIERFDGIDEIRPGNFVYYDLMQWQIGSCGLDEIACKVQCIIVSKYPERNEVIIYGGAVHFSKEQLMTESYGKIYGLLLPKSNQQSKNEKFQGHLTKLSQEHGTLKVDKEFIDSCEIGDLVSILPIHSCLTANLLLDETDFT